MAMSVEITKLDVNGKSVNIGFDVRKQSSRVTALLEGLGCGDGRRFARLAV